ncbi:hypothetical protein C2G38_2140676 [Gigaspora rosea]|uniref:Uncharacterized protein n=1 Tax=Gigaspora rosea TaxID=44941 RepID=A0A397VK75_9GLOM|nr:hypothetical protein C2G38_2140676 [Gigaspora rosea]
MVSKTSPQLHELEIRQHKENNNRKINGLSRYVLKYKEELKKRKASHNLCEKVIILNAAKAYRDELEIRNSLIKSKQQDKARKAGQASANARKAAHRNKLIMISINCCYKWMINTRNIRPDFQLLEMKNLQSCNGNPYDNKLPEEPYLFFEEELLESVNLLEDHQLNKLVLDLEHGAQKALELHQKWLDRWLHLPLSICRLDGKFGQEFAHKVSLMWF